MKLSGDDPLDLRPRLVTDETVAAEILRRDREARYRARQRIANELEEAAAVLKLNRDFPNAAAILEEEARRYRW